MSDVKPFSHAMIETCLRDQKLRFLRDEDNDIVVQFRYDPDCACELTFYLMAQGEKQEIYTLLCRSSRRLGPEEWERALVLCNTWNRERRWPKSYLRSFGNNGAAYGELCLEEHIDLEAGIHQELLTSFTMTFLASSFGFWRWLHQEQHF
ncbi:MAG: YbjN domain-containing protein [Thermogemmatispora sp.]|uniref:YbjN domain-containing protein n=1 Tax=Thermogemmatispora sp. TaxID=1968838 RepID=UPI00260AE127|nr:YbjN domain-containing protein [Thermogemmatispora sp.]MBX5457032.1 YbjN domain-containing protein [Thermogemmatispora sp.]